MNTSILSLTVVAASVCTTHTHTHRFFLTMLVTHPGKSIFLHYSKMVKQHLHVHKHTEQVNQLPHSPKTEILHRINNLTWVYQSSQFILRLWFVYFFNAVCRIQLTKQKHHSLNYCSLICDNVGKNLYRYTCLAPLHIWKIKMCYKL